MFHPPPLLSVAVYMFSFVDGGFSLPRVYVPGVCVGELHMVRDTHLFILQIHRSRNGAAFLNVA
jgi:hypothetical protein